MCFSLHIPLKCRVVFPGNCLSISARILRAAHLCPCSSPPLLSLAHPSPGELCSPQKPVPQPLRLAAPSPSLQRGATQSPRPSVQAPDPGAHDASRWRPWTSPRRMKQPRYKALTPQGSKWMENTPATRLSLTSSCLGLTGEKEQSGFIMKPNQMPQDKGLACPWLAAYNPDPSPSWV